MKIHALFCLCAIICFSSCAQQAKDEVCVRHHCVDVEVVQSQKDLMRGLMFRESLSKNRGMLFVFPRSFPYSFWMKNTLIPLDIIWLDSNRRIVHIEPRVPPCVSDPCPQYPPSQRALYVLEINAGYADTLGLKPGDQADFRLLMTNPL